MDFIDVLLEDHLEHLLLSVLARQSTSAFVSLAPLPPHFGPVVTF